jgi:signal transduction histidine kinase
VIEHFPPVLVRTYLARIAAIGGVVAAVMLGGLALAVRQTVRPVRDLALAARRFSLDRRAPDLPVAGPGELRELASAFNDLQGRIRILVEARTRMLAAIAHDLRTYLTRLRLRVEFIADAAQRDRAERDIEEMALLIDDTLAFAEQTAGPPRGACDAWAEAERVVAAQQELGRPVSLEGPAPPAARVAGSPLALRRMLGNLVDNAVRYGGGARVSLAPDGDGRLVLAVEDDGPGVPAEALTRLTEPFERLEESRARETGGAGLGLAIVKGLAESLGAELRLQNRPEGGLRAALIFPLADRA